MVTLLQSYCMLYLVKTSEQLLSTGPASGQGPAFGYSQFGYDAMTFLASCFTVTGSSFIRIYV